MPSRDAIFKLVDEIKNLSPHAPLGPLAQQLTSRIRHWFRQIWKFFRGSSIQVTGALEKNMSLWRHHLSNIPKKQRLKILELVQYGYRLPWKYGKAPAKPIRSLHNSKDLHLQKDQVWRTIDELIRESSVAPWNVHAHGLPKGMSPIKWVSKTGTSKVRVVFVWCRNNDEFAPDCGACDLPSLHKIRHIWRLFDWQLSTDKHNSFHHVKIHKDDLTWCGFSLHPSELPPAVAPALIRKFGTNFIHRPTGRLVFVLKGLPQGATASTAVYNNLSQTVLHGFLSFKHGSQLPRGTVYVDDFKNLMASPLLANGQRDLHRGFHDALLFQCHFLVRMVRLGFYINIDKTPSVPLLHSEHLGLLCSSPDLTFRETVRGAAKLRAKVIAVRTAVSSSKRVPLKLVASLLGSIYSRKLLMHRAVPIMTRAMFNMLAVKLRLHLKPFYTSKQLTSHIALVLKHAWKGSGTWTADQETELKFWESVPFIAQQAPMNFDAEYLKIRHVITRPDEQPFLQRDVHIIGADTSNRATGIARFIFGESGELAPTHVISIPLAHDEFDLASAVRELLGCLRADLALLPAHITKVIILCDNFATVLFLQRSSSIPDIARLVTKFFLKCLQHSRVVVPLWLPRTHTAIKSVDAASRLIDRHAFHIPARLFWRANKIAIRLWGRGFQIDRAANYLNVMPTDRQVRLPFNSASFHPHTSGADMFRQQWHPFINWCNPPFAMLGRILALLRTQKARAALVVPVYSIEWWFMQFSQHMPHVRHTLRSGPITAANTMRWPNGSALKNCVQYKIVFVDFSVQDVGIPDEVLAAEQLPRDPLDTSSNIYQQLCYLTLPTRFMTNLARTQQAMSASRR